MEPALPEAMPEMREPGTDRAADPPPLLLPLPPPPPPLGPRRSTSDGSS
jgi:hypothetical protein